MAYSVNSSQAIIVFALRILHKLLKGIYTFRQVVCKKMKMLEVRSFRKQDVRGENIISIFLISKYLGCIE